MADVRAGEARTGRAFAALLQRAFVAGEARVAEVESALPRSRAAGTAETRGQHAVEHVDAGADHAQDALGVADAHEVARASSRQKTGGGGRHAEHQLAPPPHAEPADRIAVERQGREMTGRASSQIAVGAALDDPEPQLAGGPR